MNSSDNSPFRGQGGKFFLIGFMGSGKTHWGKIWAKKNLLDFFDLDEIIEKQEKKTIADIFEKKGEDYFREKETTVLKTFAKINNCIIACGGGTPCHHGNMRWMNEHGTTVYLSSTTHDIFERVLEEQDKRPLIKKMNKAELHFFIEQKLKEREPYYKKAAVVLNSKKLDVLSFSKRVLKTPSKKPKKIHE